MQQGEGGEGNKVKQSENANLGIVVWPESRETNSFRGSEKNDIRDLPAQRLKTW